MSQAFTTAYQLFWLAVLAVVLAIPLTSLTSIFFKS